MFGGYAIYCDTKVVALVCDNELFVEPTQSGRKFIGEVTEAPPYRGARPHFRIQDGIDDKQWLSELIRLTAAELPAPKRKKPRGTKQVMKE
jgi:TfoX/Sxy family transcriptional regulator of competence genes